MDGTSSSPVGSRSISSRTTGRRIGLWIATLATVIPLSYAASQSMAAAGQPLEAAMLGLFVLLTTWIVLWFWIATTGFWRAWRNPSSDFAAAFVPYADKPVALRTAILLPVYNEEPGEVFARVRAMLRSLEEAGAEEAFDFFVLSDSTNADIWLDEHRHWLTLQEELSRPAAVYYRRRSRNLHRKAGNIKDFCERWGAAYPLMVVLDADSLLDGRTFVEMARRMEADPKLGLLQTPTLPLGDRSLLSRCQQFASRICGPLLGEGLEWYSADGGNYWGHNAIIRTGAFMQHCGLSDLPGEPPLGGEILSHDFVEAALMQRAGYKVRLACDLTASYEQSPTTLPEFAQRDQRWCQGNLQHARLVVSRRIPMSNRFHFATGVMSYLSAPLWLAFIILGAIAWFGERALAPSAAGLTPKGVSPAVPLGVFAIVMGMLVAPRVWGTLLAARQTAGLAGFGGAARLVASLLFEFVISVVTAPIMMAFHTMFVVLTLAGRKVEWNSQYRSSEGVPLRQAWSVHRVQTVAGIIATVLLAIFLPESLLWLSPVLFGLIFSAPISMAISSARLGAWFKRRGLLQVPEEVDRPAVVKLYESELQHADLPGSVTRSGLFRRLLDDPMVLRSHVEALRATSSTSHAPRPLVKEIARRIANNRWNTLTNDEKRAVLVDPAALGVLHRFVWRMKAAHVESQAPLER